VPIRCLIVDDSEDFLASARRLLSAQGISIVGSAHSSVEALRLVDELQPDITLVDVELGEEDGIALAATIVGQTPGARVVLISSHDVAELGELLADSPAAGFIPKTELGAAAVRRFVKR
jgi:two-component system, NarL family, nitrate/nitrite response regulator NarL